MADFTYAGKPQRLDKALAELLGPEFSRERVKRLIGTGCCSVDGRTLTEPAKKVLEGQHISVVIPPSSSVLEPEPGDVDVLWQDSWLLVINKPAGLTTHPAPSCPQGTLIQRLLSLYPSLADLDDGWRPGVVHRLDKETSGLILVALQECARLRLAQAFADRSVNKTYLALVQGTPLPSGSCREPLGRDPAHKTRMAVLEGGKAAHTEWTTLFTDPDGCYSLLAVCLHTGRTHQIRVHMAHIGHPLLGDRTYGTRESAFVAPRQMLHAWKLGFTHPVSGEACAFTCPPPTDMFECLVRLTRRTERVVITGLPGCGKSSLTRLMQEQGFPTWSADDCVKTSYEAEGEGWQALHYRYRGRFTQPGRPVDKQALTEAIMATPGMREEVESLIHPIVYHHLDMFWKEAEGQEFAFAEVPLWLETGQGRNSQQRLTLVGVSCPEPIRHARLKDIRHWPEALIRTADSWQWPEARKMAACDLVVDNSGTSDALHQEAHRLVARLRAERAARFERDNRAWLRLWSTSPE